MLLQKNLGHQRQLLGMNGSIRGMNGMLSDEMDCE